ncbi:phage gp6-like head-tail connector protein [Clostridium botulinum]|uniref:Phage gp6-like head-tail connector protein n=1 Tax=Clostridium botulinum TaxID=1491 RepID=A0A846J924_CLOBO|nr:phage protein, phi-105 family [Clostridium botulinum A3 str. Loch Maree]NFH66867.1 phage gp6-like head-tail connector protein [Clostridium botulinum]NFJ10616.1 phage gp6-like head-tail connector protein [Clostridium botulinum]NFK15536.1 phage gp6-like head-tail connector protein [Clostridium botulinum]NFM95402.1 phage gp6-like head-tail connector protein [Clostridium botulinum]
MIVTLEEIKQYLRIESDCIEEDNFLELLEKSAEQYIKNSTGKKFDNKNELARLACLIFICDRYENRGSADLTIKAQNALSYILTQLSYCYVGDKNES